MDQVRALRRSDIPSIARLHRRAFGHEKPLPDVEAFLDRVLWENPWRDDDSPSLVLEGAGGGIAGCLGVMVRPMIFRNRPVRAAVTHNFMVDPDARRSLSAIRLMRAVFGRGQDLTVADGTGTSRSLWEASGGSTLHSWGFRWLRVLKPARFLVHLLERREAPSPVTAPLSLIAGAPDAILARTRRSPVHVPESDLGVGELDPPLLRDLLLRRSKGFPLRPIFEEGAIEWLFGALRKTRRDQTLRHRVVTSDAGEPVGWFIYYSRPGGIGIVLQMEAEAPYREQTLELLLRDARSRGNAGVSGQVTPAWCDALRSGRCIFDHPDLWTLVRSGDPEIRGTLEAGDFFLTRLENESWMRFAF